MAPDQPSRPKYAKAPELAQWATEGEGDGRAYQDPFEPGARYPSVTTVLKLEAKNLDGWKAMKVAEAAIENWQDLGRDPEQIMKWLPYAANRFRDERAWVGSGLHAAVDADAKGEWFPYELDPEQEAMLEQWELFKAIYQVRVLLSEFTVKVGDTMGTADLLIEVTNLETGKVEVWLVDTKTSHSIWPGHHMQLSALSKAAHYFERVDEDTPGAALHKYKDADTGKQVKSWWIKRPMPNFDKVGVLHIREDKFDLIEVKHVDLHYKRFETLRAQWEVVKELKAVGEPT